MSSKTYKFHLTYEVHEDILWRDIEVPSDMRLDRLAYVILTTFDTLAYRKFRFELGEVEFMELPYYEAEDSSLPDMRKYKLSELGLRRGSRLMLYYALPGEACFTARFLGKEDLPCDTARIVAGEGKGIIDDITVSEFKRQVAAILDTGVSESLYVALESKGLEPWDIRDFDIEYNRKRVEKYMPLIERSYAVDKVDFPEPKRNAPVVAGPPYGSRLGAYLGTTVGGKGYKSVIRKKDK